MKTAKLVYNTVMVGVVGLTVAGCDDKPKETKPPEPVPVVSAPQPAPVVSSAPVVEEKKPEAPKPSHACPKGSEGDGTFKSPCLAKGKDRIMEVTWTEKTDDKGPSFRVVNKSELSILYGQIAVYFYDKAGKQLKVAGKDGEEGAPKQVCSGNIFAGPMKPHEKAVITFSCVAKQHVPEGTAAIEAEMQMVGFVGAEENRADTYWKNPDLVPDERPKGGIRK